MSQSFFRKLRRQATKEGIKAGTIAPEKRNLNAQELLELQEIMRIERSEAFKANQIKANTARFPARSGLFGLKRSGGKEVAAEAEATARLMTDVRAQFVKRTLAACGYPPETLCDINLVTGEISIASPYEA